jgi:hypothetical protein
MSRNYSDRTYSDTYRPTGSSNRFHPYQSHNNNHNSHHNSSYRPSNNNNKNKYHSNNRRPHKDRATQDTKLDDQIAPKSSSLTTSTLQKWAQATASFKRYAPRANETQIVERIETRYGSFEGHDGAPVPRYSNFEDEEEEEEEVFSMMNHGGKRGIGAMEEGREGCSAVAYVRDVKRRRMEGGVGDGVVDLTGDDEEDVDYAKSSEWSWPGGDED